jgi:hypothetical protein
MSVELPEWKPEWRLYRFLNTLVKDNGNLYIWKEVMNISTLYRTIDAWCKAPQYKMLLEYRKNATKVELENMTQLESMEPSAEVIESWRSVACFGYLHNHFLVRHLKLKSFVFMEKDDNFFDYVWRNVFYESSSERSNDHLNQRKIKLYDFFQKQYDPSNPSNILKYENIQTQVRLICLHFGHELNDENEFELHLYMSEYEKTTTMNRMFLNFLFHFTEINHNRIQLYREIPFHRNCTIPGCKNNNSFGFNNRFTFKRHMAAHHTSTKIFCDVCGQIESKANFARHCTTMKHKSKLNVDHVDKVDKETKKRKV